MPSSRPPAPSRSRRRRSTAEGSAREAATIVRVAGRQGGPAGRRLRRRWWALILPAAGFAALVAIAPPLPKGPQGPGPDAASGGTSSGLSASDGSPFRYAPDAEAFSLDFDPRRVGFDLFEGWDREQEAFADKGALAFVSGPMYERLGGETGTTTVPLGDLKLGDRVWRGPNRSAARQRAFVGIRHDGRVDFGFGELSPERAATYETFIGGLHSVYNDLEPAPAGYKGAYSISMGQQIRYFLPRIRVIYGLRPDGRLAILMSRDGLTLEQTRAMARQRGLIAAYLPDHASKSRFIVPGAKGFSSDDANWISGGATSFVHVPYMLRLSRRSMPLQGTLLAGLSPRLPNSSCGNPLQCGLAVAGGLSDRALAGLNRLMEQGVEPLARLIWAPLQERRSPGGPPQKAPLREPVITADPEPIQKRQQRDLAIRPATPLSEPEPPALPPPSGPPARSEAPQVQAGESPQRADGPSQPPDAGSGAAPSTPGAVAPAAATATPGAPEPDAPSPPAPVPGRPAASPAAPAPPPPVNEAARSPISLPTRAALPVAPPPPLSPPPPLP